MEEYKNLSIINLSKYERLQIKELLEILKQKRI